mmetsp:Transcript_34682/g.35378  ORF Transcript_34682/g.35378 Transcript_34682/m.35378 type:complete len:95 (-) Transcript_34682:341-625(-)
MLLGTTIFFFHVDSMIARITLHSHPDMLAVEICLLRLSSHTTFEMGFPPVSTGSTVCIVSISSPSFLDDEELGTDMMQEIFPHGINIDMLFPVL